MAAAQNKVWGTGRPDYTGEQYRVRRSESIKTINTTLKETTKSFVLTYSDTLSAYPHVKKPLAPGATALPVDFSTGIALPYTVLAGYSLRILRVRSAMDQPAYADIYLDNIFVHNTFLRGGDIYSEQEIDQLTTAQIDPTYATAHSVKMYITNAGDAHLYGTVGITVLITEHGTEPLERDTKVVECRVCGEKGAIAIDANSRTCSKGHVTRYMVTRWGT